MPSRTRRTPLWFVAGMALIALGSVGLRSESVLVFRGQNTLGVLTHFPGDGLSPPAQLIQFTTSAGEVVRVPARFQTGRRLPTAVDSAIPIVYDPQNPQHIGFGNTVLLTPIFLVIGGGVAIVAGFMPGRRRA